MPGWFITPAAPYKALKEPNSGCSYTLSGSAPASRSSQAVSSSPSVRTLAGSRSTASRTAETSPTSSATSGPLDGGDASSSA